jgi:hypothetical protein
VNLVLQTPKSKTVGYDAINTDSWAKLNLSFDPTADFHEYRFDFLNDRVLFYADNVLLAYMNGSAGGIPTTAGNLILSHWSNGNPGWSGGPPGEDATTVVKYVKAYYNSSSEARQKDFETRCADPGRQGAVCGVPEGNATFFFMYEGNMTVNQTTYAGSGSGNSGGTARFRSSTASTIAFCTSLAAVMLLYGS